MYEVQHIYSLQAQRVVTNSGRRYTNFDCRYPTNYLGHEHTVIRESEDRLVQRAILLFAAIYTSSNTRSSSVSSDLLYLLLCK